MRKAAILLILFLIIFHFYKVEKAKKQTALEILDSLRILELEVKYEQEDNDKIYLSPKNYARRIAIIDCEELIYEKYKLWN